MPLNQGELVKAIVELSKIEDLKVTIVESGKGACLAGGSALLGGILGGPVGLAIGGTIGSVFAAWNGSGKFKSVAVVIMEMSPNEKERLGYHLKDAVKDIDFEDALQLLKILMANDSMKILLIQELCKFMKQEMGLSIAL